MSKQLQLRGISHTPSEIEEWKDIPGFDGRYSVSTIGRVRSNIAFNKRGKIMSLRPRNKYLAVNLFGKDNLRKTYNVHRLVAQTFLGEIPKDMQVNHINGNRQDNKVENLEIVSASENCRHAFRIGLSHPSDNGLKKHVKVLMNGKAVRSFCSIREMCREMHLDRRSVLRTLDGTWKQYNGYTFAI